MACLDEMSDPVMLSCRFCLAVEDRILMSVNISNLNKRNNMQDIHNKPVWSVL
jgi:hypothetical protein